MTATAIYPSLKDRVVFVSGGGSGIGAAIVEHFCQQGAKVGFVDIDEDASKKLAAAMAAAGHHEPCFVACDLRDVEALRAAIDEIRKALGPITVLVNNAANDQRHDLDFEEFYRRLAPTTATPILGLPGLSAPMGLAQSRPVGVHLIADRYGEDVLLDAGAVLERANGRITPATPESGTG